MVSFERVFEVSDLPHDILEDPSAPALENVRGELVFDNVRFTYNLDESKLLKDVKRYGRMEDVGAVLSLTGSGGKNGDAASDAKPNGDLPGLESEMHASQAREVALDAISFRAAPGQLVALVGPSGAGKTTLTYLISRLYDPTSGRILIDGHDLRNVKLNSLSSAIGMVTQENYLFHDTIRTNLLYAKVDARQSEVEAGRACRQHSRLHYGLARAL